MESTLLSTITSTTSSKTTMSILSKSPLISQLHRSFSPTRSTHLHLKRCIQLTRFGSGFVVRGPGSVDLLHKRLQFAVNYSTTSFGPGGGNFGGNVGGGGGGDGGGDASDNKPSAVAASGVSETGPLSSDVIILDVGGMTCGGCAASVKRILESQPQVSSANVNLTTETAIVWPVSEAKVVPNWRKDVGEALAKHLSSCGFTSNLRDEEAIIEDIQS